MCNPLEIGVNATNRVKLLLVESSVVTPYSAAEAEQRGMRTEIKRKLPFVLPRIICLYVSTEWLCNSNVEITKQLKLSTLRDWNVRRCRELMTKLVLCDDASCCPHNGALSSTSKCIGSWNQGGSSSTEKTMDMTDVTRVFEVKLRAATDQSRSSKTKEKIQLRKSHVFAGYRPTKDGA